MIVGVVWVCFGLVEAEHPAIYFLVSYFLSMVSVMTSPMLHLEVPMFIAPGLP
jgi:hypothetical protein